MTIDEGISKFRKIVNWHERNSNVLVESEAKKLNQKCADEYTQVVEWLEELKALNKAINIIYKNLAYYESISDEKVKAYSEIIEIINTVKRREIDV